MRRFAAVVLLSACLILVASSSGCGSSGEPLLDEPTMYQANPGRTGEYVDSGPTESPQLMWTFETDSSIWSTPAVYGGMVYFGAGDGRLYALDAVTGKQKWVVDTGEWGPGVPQGSPAVSDGVVYYGGADGCLYTLDARTGNQKWTYETGLPDLLSSGLDSGGLYASPAVSDGVVYIQTEAGELLALDAATGRRLWQHGVESGWVSPYPLAVSEGVVYSNEFYASIVDATDAKDGGSVWRLWWGDKISPNSEPVFSMAASAGVVYVNTGSGCRALDAATGDQEWIFENDQLTALPPAICDDVIYVGGDDGRLYALDAQDGARRWDYAGGGRLTTAPSVANGLIYFGNVDGHLHALDSQTGAQKWEYVLGSRISTSLVPSGGMMYFGSTDGCLYALE